jgi:type 1 glutamine amidotransferase
VFLSRRTFIGSAAAGLAAAPSKRVAFVAGPKSHGYGAHAHYAGCMLLAKYLREAVPGLTAAVNRDGWPRDAGFFEGANAVVVFADGGPRDILTPNLASLAPLMEAGAGLAVLHYALCVPKGEAGGRLLEWLGGYYETDWSVNPVWTADFKTLPDHPVTRGVEPFAIRDEWYYHMRFREGMRGVTPILTAVPPDSTRERKFGPHSGNPVVRSRKGIAEHVAWAYERPGGGRGFGFTGGHAHWAFEHPLYRRVVLNAIAWIAGVEVPAGGLRTADPTWEELLANQEGAMPEGFNHEQARGVYQPRE